MITVVKLSEFKAAAYFEVIYERGVIRSKC